MATSAPVLQAHHLVITGPMGVGKSTTGRLVAAALGRPMRDSDQDIDVTFGLTGAEIAATDGVPFLHEIEAVMLIGALASPGPAVVAAAASVVTDDACRRALAHRAFTVVLGAPTDELVRRASTGAHRRKIPRVDLERLTDERQALFDSVADVRVEATGRPGDVAAAVIETYRRR